MFRDDGEGRHPATPARLQSARDDGDVARSHQLSGAIQLLGGLVLASVFVGQLASSLQGFASETWMESTIVADNYRADGWIWMALRSVGVALLPLLGLLVVISIVSHVVQTGPMFTPQRVGIDPGRLSPSQWFSRVLSPSQVVSTLLDIPKLILVMGAAGLVGYLNLNSILALGSFPVGEMMTRIMGLILKIGFQTALILFAFGVIDYALQTWSRNKRLRMTDEQLREELRMQSGNPQTIDQRRRMHYELANRDGS